MAASKAASPNPRFKLLLIGNSCGGKSSLLDRYLEGWFSPHRGITIGVDFRVKTIKLEGMETRFQIWDTYGGTRVSQYIDLIRPYFHGVQGVMLVYDITQPESFESIKTTWLCCTELFAPLDVQCLLIGSKSDLEERREVPREEGMALAQQLGIPFLETSAKTNHNVTEAFELLAKLVFKKTSQPGNSSLLVREQGRLSRKTFTIRLLLLGDSGVGMASILSQYTSKSFLRNIPLSVYKTKTITLEGKKIKLLIWETHKHKDRICGISAVMGVLLGYDITNQESFKSISSWIQRVEKSKRAPSDVQYLLVGNNSHLEALRKVPMEEGMALAQQLGIPFLETSAETNHNITEAFQLVAGLILKKTPHLLPSPFNDIGPESFTDEEERHLKAFEAALTDKGSLEQTIMHCLFFGHPRGGKSSLMKRLTGDPPTPGIPSTGVAEKIVQVEVRKLTTSTVMAMLSEWNALSFDDEAIALMATAARYFAVEKSAAQPPPLESCSTVSSSEGIATTSAEVMPLTSTEATPLSSDEATPTAFSDESSNVAVKAAPAQLPEGYVPPAEVLKQAIKRRGLEDVEQYLQSSLTLYLTDTGGQMEFQELLPALVAGPSVFFVVFRLDQDLNKTFTIEYLHPDGKSAKPYQSRFSVKETLLQSLASIASMGTYVYSKKLRKQVPLKPKVVFVGTHKDKVSQRKIAQIDRDLQQIVKTTSLYCNGQIEFASESWLVVTVNNLSPDDSDFQAIRSVIERIAEQGDFKVSSPSTWFIFSLIIRQQRQRVITHEECFGIAQKCGIDSRDELNEALWFLSTKVGLVRHFRGEGLEELEEIVIINPQILFDRITKLIVETFMFHKVPANVHEEFKRKGIFPLDILEQLSSSDDEDQLLTVSRLVKLLEHLHIVARLHSDTEEVKYFMPCALAHAGSTAPVLDILQSLLAFFKWLIFGDSETAPPLLVTFKCGYCPKGLFGALSVFLLANKMKSQMKWKLQTDQIFKNAITLSVGPYDTMTLALTPTYMVVSVGPANKEQHRMFPINETCTEVRRCIETAVQEVTSSLNYTRDAEHTLAFYCPGNHEGLKDKHPAIVQYHNNEPCSIQCELTQQNLPYNLPKGHQHWFHEHSSTTTVHSEIDSTEQISGLTLKELLNLERGRERLRLVSELIPYWEDLAIELDFPTSTIEQIKIDNRRSADQCREMLSTWLGPQSPSSQEPTWESLITAMKNIDLTVLASKLERMITSSQ